MTKYITGKKGILIDWKSLIAKQFR